MSNNKLIGAAIGFMIGMLLGLQMCSSCNHSGRIAPISFEFGAILGIICAILGAIIAKDKKDE
jgi:uncharacterized protein YacL